MPRRRLKHKQIIETIEQDDLQVVLGKIKSFWADTVRPYESIVWTVVIVAAVAVGGWYWWKNIHSAAISDANLILSQARSDFMSGDVDGAMSELSKVLPGGPSSQPGINVAAEMVHANISFASGDYETAISILTRVIPIAPDELKVDLLYELSMARANKGDYEGALQSLEEVKPSLGAPPDDIKTDRQASVWDRYYLLKGKILINMKKEEEGVKFLLKVGRQSPWADDAAREIAWMKARPVEALPVNWGAPKS
jgi:predicted negative regulator of RcsB-dependent stress response